MNDLLIVNGRVIDPACGRDEIGNVLIRDGRITAVGKGVGDKDVLPQTTAEAWHPAEVIDAAGKIVCPGLIDLHVHCREPGHEEEETIASAAAAAVAGGFTTIVAMPNTHPPVDDERAVKYVIQRAIESDKARVLPVGCITKGREGKELAEIGAMVEAGAVAFSDDGDGIASSSVMQRALQYTGMLGVPIMQHCQDPELMSGQMNSGAVAVRLGLGGISAMGEKIMLQRDLELLARTGGRYHAQHISSASSVELIRAAKAEGLPVTAEATPHHLLLTDAACMSYDPNYKVNPPLRMAADVEALRAAVADGTIDCLASDHAPHSAEEKELEFGLAPFGIISLDCSLGLYVKALVESGIMDWPELIARLTCQPAAAINRPLGTLAVGTAADVTVIDPNLRWKVDLDKFASLSRNCPYHNWKLSAKAVMTVVDGQVKFKL